MRSTKNYSERKGDLTMSKKGIDLSKWNGTIDFSKVKADGISFIIPREGYRTAIDPCFIEYVKGAREAGIDILGVYHFIYINGANPAQNAIACVNNMVKAGLDPTKTWIFADLEYDTWTQAGVKCTKELCTRYTKEFLEALKFAGCTKVGIYANLDYYRNYYDWVELAEYRDYLWLAYWSGTPSVSCAIQQNYNKGRVNGINGDVDMNILFDESMLEPSSEKPKEKKTVDELAKEVLDGLWGNGDERKKRLSDAGYDYSAVQKRVNELLSGQVTPEKKTVDELAKEVLAGKWGNGDERKKNLIAAGYDYDAVQAKVNQLLKK